MKALSIAFCIVLAVFSTLGLERARAQPFPSHPIRVVVPFPAGGGVDLVARILASPLAEQLGQPVIIENRPGAGGALGASSVAQAAPDGYTLLLGANSTHGTNPSVHTRLSYHPIRDFVPLALVSTSPFFLLSHPALSVNSVQELIKLAQNAPGKLNFGSYGVGSINHLAGELFISMANIQANHIPYRGSAPAITDLLAGRLDFVFDGVATLSYVSAGTLRVLATASKERAEAVPERPTIAESAIPDFDVSLWFGLFAPSGTSPTLVSLLNEKTNQVLSQSRVREALEKLGMRVEGGPASLLAGRVEAELKKWGDLARERNIRVEP